MKKKKIGFISTRLAGTDGVSLETRKWAEVLEREDHECFYMAGELDMPAERSFPVPACHFLHPGIQEIYSDCFGKMTRSSHTSGSVQEMKSGLKQSLRDFVAKFELDLLIPENALAIPLNLPLGLAITEFGLESGMPMLAHHHDFFWERQRFLLNGCWDYLNQAFPPNFPMIQHAVLNSSQCSQLSLRTGVAARIVPNVMDFRNPPPAPDGYADDLRQVLGLAADERIILQPTRVVQRKGIEHAIELVNRLRLPAALVITHASGDEGGEYFSRVRDYSELLKVKTLFCADRVADRRGTDAKGVKKYTLADFYGQADLVTYPSSIEGFGNAFLEAIYHRRPLMVNNYAIYNFDIRPKGFQAIEIDNYVTEQAVAHTRQVLLNPEMAEKMTEKNYRLGRKFFSYEVLRQKLTTMLVNCFGA